MKKIAMQLKSVMKTAAKSVSSESAQGATEYILILVIIVGLVLMFKGRIMSAVSGQMSQVEQGMSSVDSSSSSN